MLLRRALASEIKSKATTLQAADRQEKRNSLNRRIEQWRECQVAYMPGVPQLRENNTVPASSLTNGNRPRQSTSAHTDDTDIPEKTCLWLPSSVHRQSWATVCVPGLAEKEHRFRIAQADGALAELRRQLRITATLRDYKRTQIGGTSQRMSTRTGSLLTRFAEKTERCAARYRAAYNALTLLDLEGDWRSRLKHLADDDIRSPHRQEDDPSEGRRELPWIWLTTHGGSRPTVVASPDEVNDSKASILV